MAWQWVKQVWQGVFSAAWWNYDVSSWRCSAVWVIANWQQQLLDRCTFNHPLIQRPGELFANRDSACTFRTPCGGIYDLLAFLGLGSSSAPNDQAQAVLARSGYLEQYGARNKLATLASLFDYLLGQNALANSNPEQGVKRPPGAKRPSGQGAAKGS